MIYRISLTVLAVAGLIAASDPASAQTQRRTQDHMPFPMLMNALLGGGTARPERRLAPHEQARRQAAVPRNATPQRSWSIPQQFLPAVVSYDGPHAPGTVVIDTNARHLYLVEAGGKARRYGVGVGRPGFEWAGTHRVTRKAEWPDWRPPTEMKARARAQGQTLPDHMPGGPQNPLGARALYLGSTLYRIHGSNEPWTIGQAVSSGCIRMRNEDVIDLYERVPVGAKVVVL